MPYTVNTMTADNLCDTKGELFSSFDIALFPWEHYGLILSSKHSNKLKYFKVGMLDLADSITEYWRC